MPRLTKIEKLARDICWAGWCGNYRPPQTKAQYWARISPEARSIYIDDAKRLVFLANKIGATKLLSQILQIK